EREATVSSEKAAREIRTATRAFMPALYPGGRRARKHLASRWSEGKWWPVTEDYCVERPNKGQIKGTGPFLQPINGPVPFFPENPFQFARIFLPRGAALLVGHHFEVCI